MPMNSTSKGIFLFLNNGMKGRVMSSRLCLVHVKAFPENIPFSGKENVFMCLVVFQKIFRKIFSGLENATRKKTKPEKQTQHPDWRSTLDWVRRRSASRAPVRRPRRRSRSHEASIAIGAKARWRSTVRSREASIAISRSTAPIAIGVKASSRSRIAIDGASACEQRRLELGACKRRGLVMFLPLSLALSLSLSLSLSLRNSFEVKIGTEIHFRSQSLFFWVNGNQFPENSIFRTNQPPAFPKMYFRKWFSPKTQRMRNLPIKKSFLINDVFHEIWILKWSLLNNIL